jgi:chromosome transmission fidelity protein 4
LQDKVTLKMFASIIEAGKLERALDLVERLHLEKSFDLAMTIADNHRKLVSLIEQVKERKFPDQASDDEEPGGDDYDDESVVRRPQTNHGGKRISPDSTQKSRMPFGEAVNRSVRQKQM